ncbi:MAG: endopeptidase La [Acidobacteriota bacterium]
MPDDPAEMSDEHIEIPNRLPVLPLRDVVIYPFIIMPLSIARDISINAVDHALTANRMILLLSQKDAAIDEPKPRDLYRVGTVAVIMRLLKLPDERVRVLVQGVARAQVHSFGKGLPYLEASIRRIVEKPAGEPDLEQQALMRSVKKAMENASEMGKSISSEVMVIASNLEDPGRLADLVASNLDLNISDAQDVLTSTKPLERLRKVNSFLSRELQLLTMQQEINTVAREEMDRSQREFFLRQQLKAIQLELGEGNEWSDEISTIRTKAREADLPDNVIKEVETQIRKLERMNPESGETAMVRSYLDWLIEFPWLTTTDDNLDIGAASRVLDEDHYGLEAVKERILEFLAVRQLNPKMRGPVLCFVGPPGVGKTSLGRSIARTLGRKFVRISLGGVRDEAEIRGHRRTYIGAMPGRIVQGLHQAGTSNPVLLLDEIDKIGADHRGDPAAALLEVLDPEQNHAFRDHYMGIPVDLSRIMFLATANMIEPVHPAFRDRMELIELSGYTEEEKLEIARQHIVPRQVKENGLTPRKITFDDKALRRVISGYTREAGLRRLEQQVSRICRKVARRIAEGAKGCTRITETRARKLLGVPPAIPEELLTEDRVGVVVGLAWTPSGGAVLFVEASTMAGKGRLILTGHLGDVMQESARAALSYARSRAASLGLSDDDFARQDIHIHVPEGAIPKDGPSAGITMATALISALTGRRIRHDLAMTGEITLRGHVMPVGGIKEKVLAARRMSMKAVLLPAANRAHIEEIPVSLRPDLDIIFVSDVSQVLDVALLPLSRKTTRIAGSPRRRGGRAAVASPVRKRSTRAMRTRGSDEP